MTKLYSAAVRGEERPMGDLTVYRIIYRKALTHNEQNVLTNFSLPSHTTLLLYFSPHFVSFCEKLYVLANDKDSLAALSPSHSFYYQLALYLFLTSSGKKHFHIIIICWSVYFLTFIALYTFLFLLHLNFLHLLRNSMPLLRVSLDWLLLKETDSLGNYCWTNVSPFFVA